MKTWSLQLLSLLIITQTVLLKAQSSNPRNNLDSLESIIASYSTLDKHKVDMLNQLGYEYWIIDPSRSEELGVEALEIAKILPYPEGIAFSNRVVGVSHWARGNIDLSFRYLLNAEAQYTDLGDSLGLANSVLNLGMAYADKKSFAQAESKYNKSLDLFSSLNESSRIATTYTKIADLKIEMEDFDKAYEFLARALPIHQENKYDYGIAEVNRKLGEVFIAKEDFSSAISSLLLAIQASSKRVDRVGIADASHKLGYVYLLQGNRGQAKEKLDISENLAETYDLKKIQKDLFFTFYKYYEQGGAYQKAVAYLIKYNDVKEDLFNEEKSNIITIMETERTFHEKEKELAVAQKNLDLMIQQNKANKSYRMAIILGFIAFLALGWGMIQRRNRTIVSKDHDLAYAREKSSILEDKIVTKEKELTSYTLNFVQKNKAIDEIKSSLEVLKAKLGNHSSSEINKLQRKLDAVLRVDEEWADFRKHFEAVHPKLIDSLKKDYPKLTSSEFKLIALLRLSLNSKEISSVLGISPDSVKTARHRLRKKLGLQQQESLFDFLNSLS